MKLLKKKKEINIKCHQCEEMICDLTIKVTQTEESLNSNDINRIFSYEKEINSYLSSTNLTYTELSSVAKKFTASDHTTITNGCLNNVYVDF